MNDLGNNERKVAMSKLVKNTKPDHNHDPRLRLFDKMYVYRKGLRFSPPNIQAPCPVLDVEKLASIGF